MDAIDWTVIGAADPLARPQVQQAAVRALTDVLAASLSARTDPDVERLLGWAAPAASGRGVVGQVGRFTREDAALVGGFQAHALDLDDTHAEFRGHPSAVLFPALWALVDDDTAGADLLAAHVVGVEFLARLGRLAGRPHHAAGWHPTAVLGPLGAAVAGARLVGLDAERTAMAVALAASQVGGTRAQFGTPAKPLHAGLAAAAGVRAVQWAQRGLTAAPDALWGDDGLFAALSFENRDPAGLFAGWGERWAIEDPGLWFKRYPFCSAAMSAHEAAERLAPEIDVAAIESIRIVMRPGSDAPLRHRRPRTGAQARFSSEYIVALALLGHPAVDERFRHLDEDALALAARATRAADGEPGREAWARVEVRTTDGRKRACTVGVPSGAPTKPLTEQQLRAKLAEAISNPDAVLAAIADLPTSTIATLDRALAASISLPGETK